jgi:hypothetical protein
MSAISRLELQPKKEAGQPSLIQEKLELLYRIFNSCLRGSGHIEEALDAAEMLAEFLGSSEVKKVSGLMMPKWEDDLARFFIEKGLIHHAREAAKLRGTPLTVAELRMLDKAMGRKKTVKAAFDKLAAYFCEEGRLEQASIAAKLAGRSLTVEEIERIKSTYIFLSFQNADRTDERR